MIKFFKGLILTIKDILLFPFVIIKKIFTKKNNNNYDDFIIKVQKAKKEISKQYSKCKINASYTNEKQEIEIIIEK